MSNQHVLKIHPAPLADLLSGAKTCEVRFNDRGFEVGDTVRLVEISPETGNWAGAADHVRTISHIQTGYGLPDGMCVLSYADTAQAQLEEAVGLIRETLDEMFFEDYPKLEDFLSRLCKAEQQEAELWHCKACRIESGGDGECPACDKPFEVGDLPPKEAQGAQAGEFQREDRYWVAKQQDLIAADMAGQLPEGWYEVMVAIGDALPGREFLVIESDWPEYETKWAAIQARMAGQGAQAVDERAAFESHPTFVGMDFSRAEGHAEYYESPFANGAWGGWQARAALATQPAAPVAVGEPVATVLSSRVGNDTSTIDKALPDGTQLFLSPPAAAHGECEPIGTLRRDAGTQAIQFDPIGDPHIKDGMPVYAAAHGHEAVRKPELVGYFAFCEDKQKWLQQKPKGAEFNHLFTPLYAMRAQAGEDGSHE